MVCGSIILSDCLLNLGFAPGKRLLFLLNELWLEEWGRAEWWREPFPGIPLFCGATHVFSLSFSLSVPASRTKVSPFFKPLFLQVVCPHQFPEAIFSSENRTFLLSSLGHASLQPDDSSGFIIYLFRYFCLIFIAFPHPSPPQRPPVDCKLFEFAINLFITSIGASWVS